MGMAHRPLGGGSLTLRGMFSLDPTMGKDGYPLLFQTGETADGVTPLIDRQHPHDFLMELAAVYSHSLSEAASVFLYAGYPGEPALGPPTFMHRFSGIDNPEAPLGHHWLDATHITFGVLTGGVVWNTFKIEGSVFNGREPDEHRWNFDPLRLNSTSLRLTWNPTANWSMQASWGSLNSPEALEPDIDQQRITASVSYNRTAGERKLADDIRVGAQRQAAGRCDQCAAARIGAAAGMRTPCSAAPSTPRRTSCSARAIPCTIKPSASRSSASATSTTSRSRST